MVKKRRTGRNFIGQEKHGGPPGTILARDRLREAEVGEEIAEFLIGETGEQACGHQARGGGGAVRGPRCARRLTSWPSRPRSTTAAVVLTDEESAERAAVFRGEQLVHEALADLRAGIDDAREQRAEIVALICGEVGTDASAFVEKRVARFAALREKRPAFVGIAGRGGDDAAEAVDLGAIFGRGDGGGFGKKFFRERGDGFVLVLAEQRDGRGRDRGARRLCRFR